MARVALTGSSGFLGRALCAALEARGDEVRPLVRPNSSGTGIRWDPVRGEIDREGLEGVDALVHLAAENVGDTRWTAEQKRRIEDSRVKGTSLLARTLAELRTPPKTWVSASAIGYYGDTGDAVVDEACAPGDDFLARVCVGWEAATEPAAGRGIRLLQTRFGVVLHPEGGALAKMLPAFRFGVGGKLGSGRQWMSWIARADAVRAILHVLERSTLTGPVNVTAPTPVTNEAFTEAMGTALGRPTFMKVPGFAMRAAFGEMAEVVLLSGTRALPRKLLASGFAFEYPALTPYLRSLF